MTRTASAAGLLLDTCACIWLAGGDPLSPAVARAIDRANEIFISPVSAWEIGMLSKRTDSRALRLVPDAKTWFTRLMEMPGMRLAFTPEIAIDAAYLPEPLHADPADRMLIATARSLGMPIVTRDRQIMAYAALGHVHVIPC